MVSEERGHFGGAALKIWHPREFDISALSSDLTALTAESLVISKNNKDSAGVTNLNLVP